MRKMMSFGMCAFVAGAATAFTCSDAVKAKARDFIDNEKQFHLGFIPTEQSNPITATLEDDFKRSTLAGVQCLQRGDRQIPITMRHVFAGEKFEKLVASMVETLKAPKGRIIFSGCGATGRLSILLESMWRDFFHRRAAELTEAERALADRSASIMTGGDFALIRSVEFFEDFAEGGRRQAAALDVGEGDTFVAITEGGETSSVLGTLQYAAEHGAKCFLVFNNPADLLRARLDRCREAIDNPKVTVLDIYCGSMSVAGSTRMQATSSEQLLGSCALEAALVRVMPRFAKETAKDYTVAFEELLAGLESPGGRAGLVKAIDFEKGVYEKGGRITYIADKCMLDLFTDNTERSPTFMLPPLRSSRESNLAQSWAFVKNPFHPTVACWNKMMRRHPRCLEFTSEDARSLKMPQRFIDSPPLIKYSDLITYMIGNEPAPERIRGYKRAAAVTLTVGDRPKDFVEAAGRLAAAWPERIDFHIGGGTPSDAINCDPPAGGSQFTATAIWVNMPIADSPLEIWKHLAVKLAFNCLSTGTMAAMGRVAGNWMSWVSISNKKLIDRGIRLLVELGGVSYEEAAQRLFAAEEWVQSQDWTGKETPCAVQVALAELRASGAKDDGARPKGLDVWPALDASDQLLYKSIHEPRVVAEQPAHTHKEMVVMPDGEIRYYGRDFVDGEVRGVYLSSRDRGLSWKTVLRPDGDLGPMAKCPWADYYLSVVPPAKKGGFLRCVRSKDGPTGKVAVKWTDTASRSLAFFRPMQPLEKSRRWIMAGARTIDGVSRIALAISSDDGETWRDVVVTNAVSADHLVFHDKSLRWNNGCCEPTIVELSNGDLLMAVRATFRHHYLYTSKDGGETWDGPKPAPMFCASNTMPTFLKLKDGRILFFWNNTEPLPKRDPSEYPELNKSELSGRSETVFTNRDALHAAISEDDGRTWIGFREVARNAIRNRPDFREYGNRKWREIDKSVHQTQPMEMPDGKIILPYGQGSSCRICLFDVSWLYETDRFEDFKGGLDGISNHLFVKSLAGNFRGWSGHCAFNRVPGALLVREPDTGPATRREVLQLCRIRDERLVSDRQGVVWNFPAGLTGRLELECRIDGEGFQLALCDHWFNPCDEFVGEESALAVPVTADTLGGKGTWVKLSLAWDWTAKTATLTCGERTQTFQLKTDGKSPFGPSYMHLQTLAEGHDPKGAYFRSFSKTAK